ncbi:MAG: hypothetical protein JWN94_1396 [Betaproteobacteria bacterium]|nr:hypothetical protein [Betaproteobacteria bacterium]
MTIEKTDAEFEAETLGAEALPGGYADIRRALEPLPDAAAASVSDRRGDTRAGYDGRRKQASATDE